LIYLASTEEGEARGKSHVTPVTLSFINSTKKTIPLRRGETSRARRVTRRQYQLYDLQSCKRKSGPFYAGQKGKERDELKEESLGGNYRTFKWSGLSTWAKNV